MRRVVLNYQNNASEEINREWNFLDNQFSWYMVKVRTEMCVCVRCVCFSSTETGV